MTLSKDTGYDVRPPKCEFQISDEFPASSFSKTISNNNHVLIQKELTWNSPGF